MKRQASRGRLLGIFNRTRSTKPSTVTVDQGLERNVSADRESKTVPVTSESPPPKEIADLVPPEPIPAIEASKQQPLKAKRTKSFKQSQHTNKSISWDPPPLFQAYPQSVKHAEVHAPNLSADTILRCNEKKRKQKRREKTSESDQMNGAGGGIASPGEECQDGIHDLDIVRKIYVLVTSGYFLQYAGEGSFDRLPEKIMPIGQDSTAYASDAIPGKHWVLQVSHASDENGEPKLEKWSLAKRLGMRGDGKKCSASNYLLILDSPGDLESWLSVVRREIEAWGGKRYQPDLVVRPSPEVPQTLRQTPSRQFLVKRDPNQFSNILSESGADGQGMAFEGASIAATRKHSTATQDSIHSPSTSNMTTSTDQNMLDRLRSSPRMSRVSTEAKTYSTSRESSPVPSPTNLAFHLEDFTPSQEQSKTVDRSTMVSGPTSRSLPASRSPSVPASSSGAPNFSVPSFSKRYSSAYSTPPLSTASSSTSNPTRKSASPPIIKEQHDGTITLNSIRTQVSEPSGTSSINDMSGKESKLAPGYQVNMDESSPEAPSSDRPVPRRFSSLEYSRGISPIKGQIPRTPSPHPPPTSALPALPHFGSKNLTAPSHTLRRPVSMQIHTSTLPSSSADPKPPLPTILSTPDKGLDSQLPPPSRDPPPPPASLFTSVRSAEQLLVPPSKVLNRRSMPHLGLPPSAPPTGPLPTPPVPRLPPIKLSSGSLRRSMERPLRAGLGTGPGGLLKE